MKNLFIVIFALLPAFSIAQMVRYGDNITITDPVKEDLYVAGSRITINAPVYGDLLVAGMYVNVTDTVGNDLHVIGGEVSVHGYVNDDVRCAAGRLYINGHVVGDLVISGGTVTLSRNAVVTGNVMVSGGEVLLDGDVKGNVRSAGGTIEINGSVEHELDCRSSTLTVNGNVAGPAVLAAQDIIIGSNAVFKRGVRYWAKSGNVDFGHSVAEGPAVFDKSIALETPRWHYLGFGSLLVMIWYLGAAFVIILLIQFIFGNTMQKAAVKLTQNQTRTLGYGVLFLFAVPVAAAIAFVSLIGIPVGIMLLIAYVALLVASNAITAVVLANLFSSRSAKKWWKWKIVWVSLGIFIIIKFVSLTPLIGWLITLAVVCMAFGAIITVLPWRTKKESVAASGL